jgi:hypothetical protein
MAQFDACRVKAGGRLVVWLQHDLFSDQKTAIVAPLRREQIGAAVDLLFFGI